MPNNEEMVAKQSDQLDQGKLTKLKSQVQEFLDHSWEKHKLHFTMNVVVVTTSILLGGAVTLLGALGYGYWAAFAGFVISIVIGIQNAFKFGEKSVVWEAMHAEAKDVRDRLSYKVRTEKEFQDVVDQWLSLRKRLHASLPQAAEPQGQQT